MMVEHQPVWLTSTRRRLETARLKKTDCDVLKKLNLGKCSKSVAGDIGDYLSFLCDGAYGNYEHNYAQASFAAIGRGGKGKGAKDGYDDDGGAPACVADEYKKKIGDRPPQKTDCDVLKKLNLGKCSKSVAGDIGDYLSFLCD